MLDVGSTITLIDQELAREAGVKGSKISLKLKGIGEKEILMRNCEKVNIKVIGDHGKLKIKGAVTTKELNLPSQTLSENLTSYVNETFNDIKLKSYFQARAKILIGQDNWQLIATRELRETENREIAISRSLLGWTVHGTEYQPNNPTHRALSVKDLPHEGETTVLPHHEKSYSEEIALDQLIKQYFELDSLGIVDTRLNQKPKDDYASDTLKKTSRRVGKGWETGLLWKEKFTTKVDSLKTAEKRLYLLERRLDRDPAYAELYY